MPSAAYTAAAEAFGKQVQWLVEIDLDRCDNTYTLAPCTASDAGDASRCFYSFQTCQDAANFTKGTKTWRFCLNDVPWPDPATAVHPYLRKMVPVPQEIDPAKLFVFPEQITLEFASDYTPPASDSDKLGATGNELYNTGAIGEFWRNLFARNPNYPGRAVRIKRGFNATSFVLSDFEQVGPAYKLKEVKYSREVVTVTCESPLADLNKRKIPWAISEDNTIQDVGGINNSVTTVNVLDGTEYPDPADFTRNTVYVEMESEICEVTSITANALTIVRGSFGTSAAAHAAGVKVSHVACFGASDGTADNALEVLQDLMEWAGVAAADVDTDKFDAVKEEAWPDDDVLRTVRKQKTVAKLMQELRELRSILVFIDSAGKWAAAIMGPASSAAVLDDDSLILDSIGVDTDEEERVTRVYLYYSTSEDSPSDPDDFNKAVVVIDSDLEGANNFNDQKDETVMDAWVDASYAVAKIRNLARRIITRRAYGVRVISFDLEVLNGTVNVGDARTLTTRHILDTRGTAEPRPVIITAKKESGRARNSYSAVDTNYNGRYLRIGPDTMTENYDSATDEDKAFGYIGDADNRVGTTKEPGYVLW
jgi:hypothetical protein